jgi:polar amino acid transport system ATP-binding protein
MEYLIAEKLICIENLDYSIQNKKILRNIGNDKLPFEIHNLTSAKIDPLGQIVAVLGRSGSGKSTLFKILTGLVAPTAGLVTIPNIANPGEYKSVQEGEVGYVQQNYPLSRNQSVKDMLLSACNMGAHTKSKSEDLIEDYLKNWGLLDQRNLYTNQLSGGQRQRVAIIEQLLCSHHFMVFDEPFSGLDVVNIIEVKDCFRKIADQNDMNTVIFSTHDIDLAVEIADLIYIIGFEKDGKSIIPGGTIVDIIDMKKNGLAWKEYSSAHREVVSDICETMMEYS